MYSPLPDSLQLQKSSIHGYGLFAKEAIPKSTFLGISHVSHDSFDNGWIRTPIGGFYNHSEKPNCEIIEKNLDTATKVKILKAKKDIKIGEEITCTYTIWSINESTINKKTFDSWLGL